jgi:crotonobetainyl-CoA:carnitine CoA-transferase CaiB-like acyl-CoA transferase
MSGPLEGIKVVECAIWLQGPIAGTILGDLGAQAIKVEQRLTGDLRSKGIISALINTYQDVINDPQVLASNYVAKLNHPVWGDRKVVVTPVKFSKTPGKPGVEAPEFGEQTEEILPGLGYSWEDISRLQEEEII